MDATNEITAIRSRRGSKRREIELDGSPWCAVPLPVLSALAITSGDVVDPDEITARIAELEPAAARERAIRLLAYRDRSRSEMRTRLSEDGYTPQTVDATVDWLLDTGLLDDGRFAEQMARTLVVGRRYGRARSLQTLRRAGLSDEAALQALDEVAPPELERDRAAALARSSYRAGDSVERLATRLVRRGFSPADALSSARVVVEDTDTLEPSDDRS